VDACTLWSLNKPSVSWTHVPERLNN
jgi:hypothetical protein